MSQPPRKPVAELQTSLGELQGQFLESIEAVRPKLHRFCARMCGSVLDGEDVVQEVLAQAFFRLGTLQDQHKLEPWLFRIAHRKCIDFLRSDRARREEAVPLDEQAEVLAEAEEPPGKPIDETLAPLVGQLPPKERAAVLLKDLLDYRLSEIAEVVDTSVGGVKAALHRGRAKLRALHASPAPVELDAREQKLLRAYVDCFNRQDFNALRGLIAGDARLEVLEAVEGDLRDVPYLSNYAALPWAWKLVVARVDGEALVVHCKQVGETWRPHSATRVWWRDGKVVRIRDYAHIDYVLQGARIELL